MSEKTTLNKNNALYALGIFLLITGVLVGGKFLLERSHVQEFRENGTYATATVTDLSDTRTVFYGGTSNQNFTVEVSYTPLIKGNTPAVTASARLVTPGVYKSLTRGQEITIVYDSEDESVVALGDALTAYEDIILPKKFALILVTFVVGLISFVIGRKTYVKGRGPKQ